FPARQQCAIVSVVRRGHDLVNPQSCQTLIHLGPGQALVRRSVNAAVRVLAPGAQEQCGVLSIVGGEGYGCKIRDGIRHDSGIKVGTNRLSFTHGGAVFPRPVKGAWEDAASDGSFDYPLSSSERLDQRPDRPVPGPSPGYHRPRLARAGGSRPRLAPAP